MVTPLSHRFWQLAVTALVAACPCAQADVLYRFVGSSSLSEPQRQSFELLVPDFVTGLTTFGLDQLLSCEVWQGPCHDVTFAPAGVDHLSYAAIEFHAATSINYYYFDANAFTTPGTYEMVFASSFNPATLIVATTPVPESAPVALFAFGLTQLFLILRHIGAPKRGQKWPPYRK